MRQFDNKERAFLVQKFSDLKSCVLVQGAWIARYKEIRAPNHKTIKSMSVKFKKQVQLIIKLENHQLQRKKES